MATTTISKTSTIKYSNTQIILSNIGPLTTTYTAPAACFTEQYTTTRGVGTWLALGVESRWDCYPPAFSTADTAWAVYYSPGVCPASYTQAEALPWRWLAPEETGFNCCPIGFTLTAQPTFELIRSCIRSPTVEVSRVYSGSSGLISTTYTRVHAPAIAVIWRSGDALGSNKTTTPPTSSITATVTVTPENTPSPNKLNQSTIIALAIVWPILIIAWFVLAVIMYRRRARQEHAIPTSSFPEVGGDDVFQIDGSQALYAPIELQTQGTEPSVVDAPLAVSAQSVSRPPATPAIPAVIPQETDGMLLLRSKRERVDEQRERLVRTEALQVEDRDPQHVITNVVSGGGT